MLIIRDLRASRVNLLQNDFVSGLPSPFAFLGLVDAAGRKSGAMPWSLAVLPVLHAVHVSKGRTKGGLTHKGSSTQVIEIPEDIRGQVEFSLIIDEGEQEIDTRKFHDAIKGARLAGGMIVANADKLHEITPERAQDVLRLVRRGRAIVPMRGKPVWNGYGDPEPWVNAVYPKIKADKPGWRVPLAVRYDFMSGGVHLAGTRTPEIPHIFAEPVAGVGELISPKNATFRDLPIRDFSDLMFRYTPFDGGVAVHNSYIVQKGEHHE